MRRFLSMLLVFVMVLSMLPQAAFADEAISEEVHTHEVVHMAAVEPGCHYVGNVEYWYCTTCEMVCTDAAMTQVTNRKSVIVPELGGDVVHVEAKAADCYETNGNVEYWYCEQCMQVWQDSARTQLTNIKNVVVPAGHKVTHVAESCYNTEYWVCEDCETVWADEALTQITNRKNVIKAVPSHNLEHVAESCYNTEYWFCDVCEIYWADEALTQITNAKNVIKAEATHNLEHVAESCYNTEYWACEACETVWADEALTQVTNRKNVIKAEPSHELEHFDAVAATCYENGNVEYWYCAECETVWTDEALTQLSNLKNVIVPAAHNAEHVAESCYNTEYWVCEDCETVWADEALTQITNRKNVIKAEATHALVHVEAKKATCCDEGNIEHWYCTECETVWADEALTQITNHKNVILPVNEKAHNWGKWETEVEATCSKKGEAVRECELCGEEDTKELAKTSHVDKDKDNECDVCEADLTNAKTGDMIMIAVVVMVLAAAAIVVLMIKKRRNA